MRDDQAAMLSKPKGAGRQGVRQGGRWGVKGARRGGESGSPLSKQRGRVVGWHEAGEGWEAGRLGGWELAGGGKRGRAWQEAVLSKWGQRWSMGEVGE